MTINIKTSISNKPNIVIFKSLANVIAKVVGADLDNITPTPILVPLIIFRMKYVH